MHAAYALCEATRVLAVKQAPHVQHGVTVADVDVGAAATTGIDAPSHCDLTDVKSSRIYRFAAVSLAREVARHWRTRPNHAAGANDSDDHMDLRMNVRDLVGSIEMVALGGVSDDDAALETLYSAAAGRMHADPAFGIAITSLRNWTMQQWYEAGRQWHSLWTPARIPTHPAGSGEVALADDRLEQDASLAWLPLVMADASPNIAANLAIKHERAVVWLVSSAALSREGAELSHCVASYEYRCLNQRDHVASLRDLNGTRQSTIRIEMRYEHSAWVPVLVEHRAHRNAVPSDPCAAAAAALMTALRSSHLQAQWASLESARRDRHAARLRGSTAQQREAVAIHVEVLEQVLPPGMAAALLGGSLSG